MKTQNVNIEMVDAESYRDIVKAINITDLPIIFMSKWNISMITLKVPPVNTTKDNLTPYL